MSNDFIQSHNKKDRLKVSTCDTVQLYMDFWIGYISKNNLIPKTKTKYENEEKRKLLYYKKGKTEDVNNNNE